MLDYYSRRAREYERIYHRPERQHDLAALRAMVPAFLADRDVLEIACGTGYWTEVIAPAARSVLATDFSAEVLALARSKPYPAGRVRFDVADAFRLDSLPIGFTAAFAGFWWSHVERARLPAFLHGLHAQLAPGARVLFLDNRYVEGSSTPISCRDGNGDSWQLRRLDDGSTHEVLKNFPTTDELQASIQGMADEIEVRELPFYWWLSYRSR